MGRKNFHSYQLCKTLLSVYSSSILAEVDSISLFLTNFNSKERVAWYRERKEKESKSAQEKNPKFTKGRLGIVTW